jgi:hypothetical protein
MTVADGAREVGQRAPSDVRRPRGAPFDEHALERRNHEQEEAVVEQEEAVVRAPTSRVRGAVHS